MSHTCRQGAGHILRLTQEVYRSRRAGQGQLFGCEKEGRRLGGCRWWGVGRKEGAISSSRGGGWRERKQTRIRARSHSGATSGLGADI